MPRSINKLNALAVQRAKKPGLYCDGGGLYLRVSANGSKSWVLRYMLSGRARGMGLGPVALRSLAEARERAIAARKLLLEGVDPIDSRKASKRSLALKKSMTFDAVAAQYLADKSSEWKNARHRDWWKRCLEKYVSPVIGNLPITEIDTPEIRQVLDPIWSTEGGQRIQNRLERIFDYAASNKWRSGDNPARWRGHLKNLMPRKLKRGQRHLPSLPYTELGTFMARLREEPGISARALEFTILCTVRTGETLGCQWSEIDLDAKAWTIPGSRMKAGAQHRVPLTPRVIEILREMKSLESDSPYVFPGARAGQPLSNMAMLQTLKRMKVDHVTVHGFRATFKTWARERTSFARELAEEALAHVNPNRVEQAYVRGDLLEKRRKLMEAWAGFCSQATIEKTRVIAISEARA